MDEIHLEFVKVSSLRHFQSDCPCLTIVHMFFCVARGMSGLKNCLFFFPRMMWSCWFHQASHQWPPDQFDAECEMVG